MEGRLDSTRTARIELGGFNLLQAMFKLVRIAKSDVEGLTYHRVRQLVDRSVLCVCVCVCVCVRV